MEPDPQPARSPSRLPDPAEAELWSLGGGGDDASLVDLVNRVLDRGVVIAGEVTISVAGVDLVHLGLNAVLTSVATMQRRRTRESDLP